MQAVTRVHDSNLATFLQCVKVSNTPYTVAACHWGMIRFCWFVRTKIFDTVVFTHFFILISTKDSIFDMTLASLQAMPAG